MPDGVLDPSLFSSNSLRTVVSKRGGLWFERSAHPVAKGLVGITQQLSSEGVVERVVATGRYWIFAMALHETGLTEAHTNGSWTPLPHRRVFLIPPRSLLRLRLTDVRLRSVGLAGALELPGELGHVPRAAKTPNHAEPPESVEDLAGLLKGAQELDPDAGAPALARRARQLLLDAASSPSPVREVARALRIAPETVSRMFRAAYGVSPKRYIHGARISDGVLSLLSGRPVLETALSAGFTDASRFYEQFRRITRNTPGEYASLVRVDHAALGGRAVRVDHAALGGRAVDQKTRRRRNGVAP